MGSTTWSLDQNILYLPFGSITECQPITINDDIYVIGGYTLNYTSNYDINTINNQFWKYSVLEQIWIPLTPPIVDFNVVRHQQSIVPCWDGSDTIYLFGWHSPNVSLRYKKYTISTDTWSDDILVNFESGITDSNNRDYTPFVSYWNNNLIISSHCNSGIFIFRINPLDNIAYKISNTSLNDHYVTDFRYGRILRIDNILYLCYQDIKTLQLSTSTQTTLSNTLTNSYTLGMGNGTSIWNFGSDIYAVCGNDRKTIKKYNINTRTGWIDAEVSMLNTWCTSTGCATHKGKAFIFGGIFEEDANDSTTLGSSYVTVYANKIDKPIGLSVEYDQKNIIFKCIDDSADDTTFVIDRKRNDEINYTNIGNVVAGITTFIDNGSIGGLDVETFDYIYRLRVRQIIPFEVETVYVCHVKSKKFYASGKYNPTSGTIVSEPKMAMCVYGYYDFRILGAHQFFSNKQAYYVQNGDYPFTWSISNGIPFVVLEDTRHIIVSDIPPNLTFTITATDSKNNKTSLICYS